MTILNYPSDGLYPEVIALARVAAHEGPIDEQTLLRIVRVYERNSDRVSGGLSRWSKLGLFDRDGERVELSKAFSRKRGQSLDEWTSQLSDVFRMLALKESNCLPLWGTEQGLSADFVKGIAWLLAQDVFQLPRAWKGGIEALEDAQIKGEKIIQNDTRLNGLRFWARYCGFATGGSRSFFMDPTAAVRAAIGCMYNDAKTLDAKSFLTELAANLPVVDGGKYRNEVEAQLERSAWRAPPAKHLSMSLSFALRRLEAEKRILLEAKADAAEAYFLSGSDYRTISRFTHVRNVSVAR
jgi:hypothetical protein